MRVLASQIMETTALQVARTCECNPRQTYKTPQTFAKHATSQRHLQWAKRVDEKQLRVRLGEADNEIAMLRARVCTLEELVQNPKKRCVSDKTKKQVAADQGWRCRKCRDVLPATFQTDHIIPLYLGGSNEKKNLQALCPGCHSEKTADDGRAVRKL